MSNGIDRRRHARKKVSDSILIASEYRAIDLSESGMQLAAKNAVELGSRLPLQLNIDGERLELTGIVRRCMMSASVFDSHYQVGVQFDGCGAAQLLVLRRYLNA